MDFESCCSSYCLKLYVERLVLNLQKFQGTSIRNGHHRPTQIRMKMSRRGLIEVVHWKFQNFEGYVDRRMMIQRDSSYRVRMRKTDKAVQVD